MNEIQEYELRKLIVSRIAEAHPDTAIRCEIDKEILKDIDIDYFEAKELIQADYLPELSILQNQLMNKEI